MMIFHPFRHRIGNCIQPFSYLYDAQVEIVDSFKYILVILSSDFNDGADMGQ